MSLRFISLRYYDLQEVVQDMEQAEADKVMTWRIAIL